MSVGLSEWFLVPVALFLAFIWLVWLVGELRSTARAEKPGGRRIYRCQLCEHVYLDARDVPLSRCTRCGTLNKPVRT